MGILQIVIHFIIVLAGMFLFFIIKNYWPKYLESKGANQATKEDIGEITAIVESIKTDLSQKTEQLKAELSITNQHHINIKTAEREAVFNYNKAFSAWLYSLVRFELSAYNVDNYRDLNSLSTDFKKRQYECDVPKLICFYFITSKCSLS